MARLTFCSERHADEGWLELRRRLTAACAQHKWRLSKAVRSEYGRTAVAVLHCVKIAE